ncbi:DUF1345 domain-containing protein [Leucobacter muris]|uniref:DUF1345 domain-containing protein n=1 Tax=Leucobacter muris TaxID=1935379 RepID=UPI002B1F42F3|nr:DUF1345 domain-containing protein [Leucobacter muris]
MGRRRPRRRDAAAPALVRAGLALPRRDDRVAQRARAARRARSARHARARGAPDRPSRLATLVTFGASLLGLAVATDLISALGLGVHDPVAELSAIWTMLLSWAMFNWGYSRIYFSRYHREADPPLSFPGTEEPRLVDFVYLAFTNATAFAVSDVQVRSTRMRWTIVWHTTLAFFFNALIIALVINVITKGEFLSQLLE